MLEIHAAASGDTAGVLMEIGALLLALGVLGRLAARFGVPPIPVYLLAGLALGAVDAGPLTFSDELIRIGADIGFVLLLFTLGLDYAARDLTQDLHAKVRGGLLDMVLNLTPGIAVGLLLGWGWQAALVLGGVTYISSSGVIAKVVSDLRRQEHPETPTVLALLIVEDLAMVVYLPIVTVAIAGVGLASGLLTLATAAVFAALALFFAIRHGHRLTPALSPRSEETFLLTTFGLVLLVAGLAEQVSLSAAVGAFLIGIAVSGPVVDRARGAITPLRDLFAATFFAFFGLQVDITAAAPLAGVVVGLGVLTAATKVLTGWWVAREAGVDAAGRLRAGTALIARGEFSMVIAGLGVAAGVEPELGPVAAAYVLLTAIAGTLITRWVGDAVDT